MKIRSSSLVYIYVHFERMQQVLEISIGRFLQRFRLFQLFGYGYLTKLWPPSRFFCRLHATQLMNVAIIINLAVLNSVTRNLHLENRIRKTRLIIFGSRLIKIKKFLCLLRSSLQLVLSSSSFLNSDPIVFLEYSLA